MAIPLGLPMKKKSYLTRDGGGIGADEKDHGIFVMDRNGRNHVRLSPSGQGPAWSPDGTKIAFYSNLHNLGQEDIYVMNADGANIVRRDQSSVQIRPFSRLVPRWAVDCLYVALESERAGIFTSLMPMGVRRDR